MKTTFARLMILLGIIHFYNIVAHSSNLVDLSTSIHWLSDWWDYLIWLLFDWLNIDIPKIARNLIVLYFLCVGIINYSLKKDGHPSLFYLLGDLFLSDGRDAMPFIIKQFDQHEGMFASVSRLTLLPIVLFMIWVFIIDRDNTMAYEPWFIMFALFFMNMNIIALMIYHHREQSDYLEQLIYNGSKFFRTAAAINFGIFGFVAMAVIIYRFEVFKMLRWLLLLFALDLAMTYIIDPLEPFLKALPSPPKIELQ